jgi:hypothetical protein
MGRSVRVGLTVAVASALLVPVALDRDGHPFSTYPMYSRARGDAVSFVIANGLDDAGARQRLNLALVGASDDPLVVAGELRAAVRNGRAHDRCEEIARRVASSGRVEIGTVEVVTERHDVVDRTAGRPSLVERVEHARCEVRRS